MSVDLTAGEVIRTARQRAGLSQSELARRAHVTQSVISAYETNHREPGLTTLTRLIEATGHQLGIDLIPSPDMAHGLPDTYMGRRLRHRRRAVIDLCGRRGARNVRVFGSVSRGEDTSNSDVDLLVDLDPNVGLVMLEALRRELGELLGVDVDVVPASDLKPSLRKPVLAEAIPL